MLRSIGLSLIRKDTAQHRLYALRHSCGQKLSKCGQPLLPYTFNRPMTTILGKKNAPFEREDKLAEIHRKFDEYEQAEVHEKILKDLKEQRSDLMRRNEILESTQLWKEYDQEIESKLDEAHERWVNGITGGIKPDDVQRLTASYGEVLKEVEEKYTYKFALLAFQLPPKEREKLLNAWDFGDSEELKEIGLGQEPDLEKDIEYLKGISWKTDAEVHGLQTEEEAKEDIKKWLLDNSPVYHAEEAKRKRELMRDAEVEGKKGPKPGKKARELNEAIAECKGEIEDRGRLKKLISNEDIPEELKENIEKVLERFMEGQYDEEFPQFLKEMKEMEMDYLEKEKKEEMVTKESEEWEEIEEALKDEKEKLEAIGEKKESEIEKMDEEEAFFDEEEEEEEEEEIGETIPSNEKQ